MAECKKYFRQKKGAWIYIWDNETRRNKKVCLQDLLDRINKRSEDMIKLGAILEVKKFIKLRVPKNKSLSKAIGISEVKQYLQKKIQAEQLIEKISIKTRQYAKRQSTWARGHMKDWNKVNPAGLDKLLKKI